MAPKDAVRETEVQAWKGGGNILAGCEWQHIVRSHSGAYPPKVTADPCIFLGAENRA